MRTHPAFFHMYAGLLAAAALAPLLLSMGGSCSDMQARSDAASHSDERDKDESVFISDLMARFPNAFETPGAADLSAGPQQDGVQIRLPKHARKSASVQFPTSAAQPMAVRDEASGTALYFQLDNAANSSFSAAPGTPTIARYPSAYQPKGSEAFDVLVRAFAHGAEDFLYFEREPHTKQIRYRIGLERVHALRLAQNTLEFLDTHSIARLRVPPPFFIDASGRRIAVTMSVEGCALSALSALSTPQQITPPGADTCTLVLTWPDSGIRYPALLDPAWVSTQSLMVIPRTDHSALELSPASNTSPVLIAGGYTLGGNPTDTAEIYEPLSQTFSPSAGKMLAPRAEHSAVLLNNGKVLIAGGSSTAVGNTVLSTTELFDPINQTFSAGPAMNTARRRPTATLLADGRVLILGGADQLKQPIKSAEIYDPNTNMFSALLVPNVARFQHIAVRLDSNQVLIAGGLTAAGFATQSAELFDPMTNTFGPIAAAGGGSIQMASGRASHAATLLKNGHVLISGGLNALMNPSYLNTAELYIPPITGQTFSGFKQPVLTMGERRAYHSSVRLPSGDIVLAGGFGGPMAMPAAELSSAELYSPQSDSLLPLPSMGLGKEHSEAPGINVNAGEFSQAGRGVLISGGRGLGGIILNTAVVFAKTNGDGCQADNECLSGYCSDNEKVCCNTECTEECYSCTALGKEDASPDGTCGFAKQGTKLPVTCVNEVEVHNECDGQGQATPNVNDTKSCKPGTCGSQGYCITFCCVDTDCSDAGWCLPLPMGQGGMGGMGGMGGAGGAGGAGGGPPPPNCGAGGAGGAGGGGMTGLGLCQPRFPNSAVCERDRQCASGFCVDGVCCNQPCLGACQACNVENNIGICIPVGTPQKPEPPRPFSDGPEVRATCPGEGACAGFCDGNPNATCSFPPNGAPFSPPVCQCDADIKNCELSRDLCDGMGNHALQTERCGGMNGGFRCAEPQMPLPGMPPPGGACKTSCSADSECVFDFICEKGICADLNEIGARCDGEHTLRIPGPTDSDCSPFRCPIDQNACPTQCKTVADCIEGKACNLSGECVDPPGPPVISGCAIRSMGGQERDSNAAVWAWMGALGLAWLRAKRRNLR